jgi:hypothetical protein
MGSNISLQSVIDYVTTNVRGANLADVLGIQNEPALSICNDVYQETLQKPLTWRFNRANVAGTGIGILYFTTLIYQQDYPLTNANVAGTLYSGNLSNPYPGGPPNGGGVVHIPTVYNSGLVVAGGVGTLKTNWPHGFVAGNTIYLQNVGQWANGAFVPDASGLLNGVALTVATAPTTSSLTFSTAATAGTYGAPGVNDIGWIAKTVFEDFANSTTAVKPRHSIEVTMNLELESIVQPPFKLSYEYTVTDAGTAVNANVPSTTAIFRAWPVPSQQTWGIMIDYQMKPTIFTSLNQTWGVWPDELMFVIRQGVKAAALDFVEDPRAVTEYQLFNTKLDSVREIRDQERPSQTMFPDRPIMFGG